MGPYIQDGHYVYGNMHNQPYPAYYNSSWYHREPPRRFISDLNFFDDGSLYIPDNKPADAGSAIVRSQTASNIVNIETVMLRTLRIKLYALKEEDDVDMVLELGQGYSITYVTEGGLKVATGVLKLIDTTIPDTCTRYIGEFNETVATAWIGMDCSTAGKSDKRKIFVASIRGIEKADITDPTYQPPTIDPTDMTYDQKLSYIIDSIPKMDATIDKILAKVIDNDQIMDKLSELDPTKKLEYLVDLINDKSSDLSDEIIKHDEDIKERLDIVDQSMKDASDKSDRLADNIDTVSGKIDTLSDDLAGTHKESMNKFKTIIGKLGSMPYDDKVDYIYNKMLENYGPSTEQSDPDLGTTVNDKVKYIINAIEKHGV